SVDATKYSYRITLDVSPNRRIVVPEIVVMEVRLLIEVLSGKPQIAGERPQAGRVFVGHRVPEGLGVVPPPDRLGCLVRVQARGIQVIGMDEVKLRHS